MPKDKKQREQKTEFDDEFLKKCGRIFARDLLRYSENGGDMEDVTATKVYKFLAELDKESEGN